MSNLYIFLNTKKYAAKGLTLVEVIVGMLISALFLSTVLQAYVSAVSIKAKAQQAAIPNSECSQLYQIIENLLVYDF